MQEEKVTAYTFALTGFPLPPFITRRRKQVARMLRDELDGLVGMVGISLHGKVMFVHMESKNDAIVAQNSAGRERDSIHRRADRVPAPTVHNPAAQTSCENATR